MSCERDSIAFPAIQAFHLANEKRAFLFASFHTIVFISYGKSIRQTDDPLRVYRFRWYKFIEGSSRRQPVQLNDRVRQVSGTLIIREARVEDSGKYLCIVNNSVGGESVETVLTVTAPLAAEIEPSTQTIDFGRPATFTCNVRGNPIKTISWLKDGKPLGLEEPVLRIESVKKEDKGMYQCFVRNDQESAQATAELKLGGRCKLAF